MASPYSVLHCYTNLQSDFSAVHAVKVCTENPSHCICVAVISYNQGSKNCSAEENKSRLGVSFKRIHCLQNQQACLHIGRLCEVAADFCMLPFLCKHNCKGCMYNVCTVFDHFGSRFRCCPGCCPNLWPSSGLCNAKGDAFLYFWVRWINIGWLFDVSWFDWICAGPTPSYHTYPLPYSSGNWGQ